MRTILFILAAAFIFSCNDRAKEDQVDFLVVDHYPGSCAAFSTDAGGHTVLSWIRNLNDSTSEFCYSVSRDGGRSFGQPVVVKGSENIKPHSENLPKIIFKPSGEIMAIWGISSGDARNKYSGKIIYSQSFDQGASWSGPRALVTDTSGYDQRYFDVALQRNGEAAIIWLDNRKSSEGEGSAMYFTVTDGRKGFIGGRKIAESCCPCCRTDLFIDSRNDIHVLYRGIIEDSIRDMVHMVSTNGGEDFGSANRISEDNWVLHACPHTGPSMAENNDGLHFAWYTGGEEAGTFYTACNAEGFIYRKRERVTYAGKHPQLAARENGDLGLVWDESVKHGDKFFSRVGLQIRTAGGVRQTFLTSDSSTASYPVIRAVNKEGFLIAFGLKKGKEHYIVYQVVDGSIHNSKLIAPKSYGSAREEVIAECGTGLKPSSHEH
jgi:hypothetical protein